MQDAEFNVLDAERSNLHQNLCRTQQCAPKSMLNAAIRPKINAERSKWPQKSMQNVAMCSRV